MQEALDYNGALFSRKEPFLFLLSWDACILFFH